MNFDFLSYAVLFGIGVFLMVLAFSVGKNAGKRIHGHEDENVRVGSVAEKEVLKALSIDISRKLSPEKGNLEERLVKSGYVYKSVPDFHARRMYLALLYMVFGVLLGILFSLQFIGIAVLGTLLAFFGFTTPDRTVNKFIKKRRSRLIREMGFGMERVALHLSSGADIADALASTRRLGLFGEACAHLASGLNTQKSVGESIAEVKANLPDTPQFDEFVELVRIGIMKGQDVTSSFRLAAQGMRQKLQQEVVEAGKNAQFKISLITSGFVMVASMIVIIGAGLLVLMENLIF
jgi:Flp pilus assembly protein TadB